jgi:hypothetical protein
MLLMLLLLTNDEKKYFKNYLNFFFFKKIIIIRNKIMGVAILAKGWLEPPSFGLGWVRPPQTERWLGPPISLGGGSTTLKMPNRGGQGSGFGHPQ